MTQRLHAIKAAGVSQWRAGTYGRGILAFLQSGARNQWFYYPALHVYLRRGHHVIGADIAECVDIANVELQVRPSPAYVEFVFALHTVLLVDHELPRVVYIENILEPALVPFYEYLGYHPVPGSEPDVCMYRSF